MGWTNTGRWLNIYVKYVTELIEADIAGALSLLISVGILSWIITTLGKYAWDQLVKIYNAAKRVLVAGWPSDWSLGVLEAEWRKYVEETPSQIGAALENAKLLTISLTLSVFLVLLYPMFDPKQGVQSARTVYQYVTVVDAKRDIELYMKGGAVFSLAHVDDAQPKNGKGICLGPPQQEWLKEFRAAIANCIEKESSAIEDSESDDTRFEVTGYASIAPMRVGGDTSKSAKLNCKVANWRAAAVGAFLANPDEHREQWQCEDVKSNFNKHPIECGKPAEKPYVGEDPDGNRFLVKVHQWSTPEKMVGAKPADDGAVPDERRFDVEIMNRVVHIKVPEDFCGNASGDASST